MKSDMPDVSVWLIQVPFLSLDLDSLAAQISKLAVAERLFIEEDLLPTELVSFLVARSDCP